VLVRWCVAYAAPGRPVHDLSALARMCIPAPQWRGPFDPIRRLRVVADAYGCRQVGMNSSK
jgi:hypothetical protein